MSLYFNAPPKPDPLHRRHRPWVTTEWGRALCDFDFWFSARSWASWFDEYRRRYERLECARRVAEHD